MPNELPADDTTLPTSHEASDGWEIEDAGKLRASAEELHKDFEDVTAPPEDPSEANKPGFGIDVPAAADGESPLAAGEGEPEPEKVAKSGKRSPATRTKELKAEIAALTARKHAEAREVEDLERRRQTLATPPDERRAPPPASLSADRPAVPPKPTWKAFDEGGKTWEEYEAARDAYDEARRSADSFDVRQELRQEYDRRQAEIEARSVVAQAHAAHKARIDSAKAKHADFDTVIDQNLATIPNIPFLNDAVRNHPAGGELLYQLAKHPDEAAVLASLDFTNAMMDAVMASSDPAPLLLHLATNQAEHDRLLRMSPRQALIELGALNARLTPSARDNGSRPGARLSSAAPPIRPVGGAGVTADPADDDDLDFGPEYIQRQNARDFKRGIRP